MHNFTLKFFVMSDAKLVRLGNSAGSVANVINVKHVNKFGFVCK